MPRGDIKPRLHAKFGARQEPSRRDSSGAAARSDSFKLFGLAQCQGSLTRASRRSSRAQSCILAPSDDRRFHGCGPEIPADSSARVQTPASALMHGSCWTCRGSLAASRCVSTFAVSFRTSTFRTGSSGFHILDPDPVGAREPILEQCSGTGLVGAAPQRRLCVQVLELCLIN